MVGDSRFELITSPHADPVMCTLDRDLAQDDDSLELIGIDHRITIELTEKWSGAAPDTLGATAKVGVEDIAVLSIWPVHSFGSGPEKGTYLTPIAIDREGKRVPSLEKRHRECFRAPAGRIVLEEAERSRLLHEHIEPTLQRELGYRGIANPDTGYATEILAWVEVE